MAIIETTLIPVGCIPRPQAARVAQRSPGSIKTAVENGRLTAYAYPATATTMRREYWFDVADVNRWVADGCETKPLPPIAPILEPLVVPETGELDARLARIEQKQDHIITQLDALATVWGIKQDGH